MGRPLPFEHEFMYRGFTKKNILKFLHKKFKADMYEEDLDIHEYTLMSHDKYVTWPFMIYSRINNGVEYACDVHCYYLDGEVTARDWRGLIDCLPYIRRPRDT